MTLCEYVMYIRMYVRVCARPPLDRKRKESKLVKMKDEEY